MLQDVVFSWKEASCIDSTNAKLSSYKISRQNCLEICNSISASIISTTDVITTVVGTVGIGAVLAGGVPPTPVQPGTVPQGLPQPGTRNRCSFISKNLQNFWKRVNFVKY